MPEDIWSGPQVDATLNEVKATPGLDSNLPLEVRFVRRVREVVQASVERHGGLSHHAVYVLTPVGGRSVPDNASQHSRIHNAEFDAAGGLWFVGAAARAARRLPLEGSTADEVISQCRLLGYGDVPTVFCDAAVTPPALAWYPSGLDKPDEAIETPIAYDAGPSLEDLMDVVDRVHLTRLMTSLNQNVDTTLWARADKHWAHQRAEKRVQDALLAGIGAAYGAPFFVQQEVSGNAGRFDIGFREAVGSGTSRVRAILELKVARSFGSQGGKKPPSEIEAHIASGVEQSFAYADEHGVEDAACLVFDLRETEKQVELLGPRARATQLKVLLKYWRCFPTADDYRSFIVPPAPRGR